MSKSSIITEQIKLLFLSEEGMDVRELLADYAHDTWSGWMKHLFKNSTKNPDGSVTIPADLANRWTRQTQTAYASLSEKEKDSDRKEADRMLSIINGSK